MAEDNLYEAQTQTQNSQLEWQQQQSSSIPVIWGRIYSIKESCKSLGLTAAPPQLSHKLSDYYDLTTSEFSVGRALLCNLCLTSDIFPEELLKNISKKHFTLTRDPSEELPPIYIEDHSYNGTFVNGEKLGKGQRRILDNNDQIFLTHPLVKVFIFRDLSKNEQPQEAAEVTNKYYISRTLGVGACGIVKCVYNKLTCTKYAMKIVKRKSLASGHVQIKVNWPDSVKNEINILKTLKHPCVIKTQEIIEAKDAVYMVMELMEGGELFDRISTNVKLGERLCKIYFRQMVLAVMYLHKMGITHRDLKPENVLLESSEDETIIKLTDFGLSKFVGEESFMKTMCGTPLYLAPEVLTGEGKKSYGNQVDVWSLGVILFICLSGYLPFSEDYKEMALREQIVKGRYTISRTHWQNVSLPARQLMTKMLTVDPSKRITLDQILLHSWMQDEEVTATVDNLMKQSLQVDELKDLTLSSSKENKDYKVTPKRMLSDVCHKSDPNPKRRKLAESQMGNLPTVLSDDTSLADDDDTVAVIEDLDK